MTASALLTAFPADDDLVRAARGGCDTAFAQIVRRYEGALRAYCSRVLGPVAAEDAVQQAFLQALVALRDGGEREIHLRPWLYRIAYHCAIDIVRRSGRDAEELDAQLAGGAQPAADLERKERLRDVVRRVVSLPADQRRALVARELEGRSYGEISLELDASEGAVRQLIFRARTTVRRGLVAIVPLREWLALWPGAGAPRGIGVPGAVAMLAAVGGVLTPGQVAAPAGARAQAERPGREAREDRAQRSRPAPRRAAPAPSGGAAAPAAWIAPASRVVLRRAPAATEVRARVRGPAGRRAPGGGAPAPVGALAPAGPPVAPHTAVPPPPAVPAPVAVAAVLPAPPPPPAAAPPTSAPSAPAPQPGPAPVTEPAQAEPDDDDSGRGRGRGRGQGRSGDGGRDHDDDRD